MSALTNCTDAIVVNVGGTKYQTTLATLTKIEGSMLGALAEALSDGEVLFIDRDGPSFRYVLNYLRDPFAKPLLPGTRPSGTSSRERRTSMVSQDSSAH